ncbi:MAG: biotin synthase BioB [Akkermansiaceae bacterium]|nr:biotin synthase BioB [Akkermansiaceae bacterium]
MTLDELKQLAELPLMQLVEKAHAVHAQHWDTSRIQVCTLLSIKTGGCSENCAYCAQSARYAAVARQELLPREKVLERALLAKAMGATRFCMGAAWRGIRADDARFAEVVEMVRAVSALGLEVCATLGKIGSAEALALKEAGLTAYNHNLDTSPEHYSEIVTTHTYADRLETIDAVQQAGISLCCGGILGLGEGQVDRLRLLEVVSSFPTPPESFPINVLIPIPGTPLGDAAPQAPDTLDLVRMVALARLALPRTRVRLSAGREHLSPEAQMLCFYAGANSLFYGDKLLTANNASIAEDRRLLEACGLQPELPHADMLRPAAGAGEELFSEEEPHPCFREVCSES